MGLAGLDFIGAIERWIGGPLPDDFHDARAEEDARALAEGLEEVAGAVAFIRALPPGLPKAVASSSSTRMGDAPPRPSRPRGRVRRRWSSSGREHVARGKPAPDLYLHAAAALGVPIARIAIIEDSPVGVHRRGRLGRRGDRPRRRPPLPARPCRAAARARSPPHRPQFRRGGGDPRPRAGGRCGRAWWRDRRGCARLRQLSAAPARRP